MYKIQYNKETSEQYGLVFNGYPSVSYPEDRMNTETVRYRDGDLIAGDPSYGNVEITCPFSLIVTEPREWELQFRKVKKWIRGRNDQKLSFTFEQDRYYMVKKAMIDSAERELGRYGTMDVTFSCYPYKYVVGGDHVLEDYKFVYNPYDIAHPVYRIRGEGICRLTVNGRSIQANIAQSLVINTELQIAYRLDGVDRNTAVNGDYEEIYLIPGSNRITITDGFELEVIPMWRELI